MMLTPIEIEDLEEMVNFLRLFADKCHHGKEEGLYFPSLEQVGIPREGGPIGVMLEEHIAGRALIAKMTAALAGEFAPEDFANAASRYIDLLQAHIEKENLVLFVMGDQRLPAEEQARLIEAFKVFEKEVMGEETHHRLHQMLERFEHKYLS